LEYLSEPSLNSELILVNNAKLLKKDPSLYNDEYLNEIMELRKEYKKLNIKDNSGLQKQKRDIRNRIRDLSVKTYLDRDTNLFGEMIILIMDKLLTRPNFVNYNYKNEMKSLATEHILKYTWRFDPYKKSKISGQYISAFTYITTIAFNAFVATINGFNKEQKKIKEDYLETQKLFHLDHKISSYGEDYSLPKKEVTFNHIPNTLFELIKQISLDETDIKIYYPDNYKISLDEYNKITEYSDKNKINLNITPLSGKK
jgi:hypothetical protein